MTAMVLFGPAHVAVLCITCGLPVALAIIARRSPNRIAGDRIAYALAAALVINKLAALTAAAARGYLDRTDLLPMQLCDWTLRHP